MSRWGLAFVALVLSVPTQAHDYMPYLDSQAQSMQYGQMLESNLGINKSRAPISRMGLAATRPSHVSTSQRDYFSRPAPAAARSTSLSYASSPALRRAAVEGYLSRASQSNAEATRHVAAELARNNYSEVFAGLIKGTGLRGNDVADAVAAYTAFGWMIANNHLGDPDPRSMVAVRDQVAQGLSSDPRFADPRTRAELAEEMKLLFVTLHAGWQSARKKGNLRPYGDGVADMFRKFTGNDLRALRLTERGLVRG